MVQERLFPSFWLAGFECASQLQRDRRLDLTAELQHDHHADDDYRMLAPLGLRTARDGIRWHLVEREPGRFDFGSVEPLRQAAERHGVQVIWDICHFGWPEHVDPLAPDFPARYARLARAFARYLRECSEAAPFLAPINEISFLALAAGEQGFFAPFARGQGRALQRNLVRAVIAGIDAIWEVSPRARIVHTEPLICRVAPLDQPALLQAAHEANETQFASLDMLAGRLEPDLGGGPRYLDILGFNFYPDNEQDLRGFTVWRDDPRWVDLSTLLAEAYARYRRPFFISETTDAGPGRAAWLEYITGEAVRMLERGLPLQGVCVYPITNALDWATGRPEPYGLWDLEPGPGGVLARRLNEDCAACLQAARERLHPHA